MEKKRRCRPVVGSMSKYVARSASSRQKGFSSDAAMWFGTMSSSTSRPAPARARNADSPPRSAEITRGSVTS